MENDKIRGCLLGVAMLKQVLEILGLREGKPWRTMPSFEEGILKAVNECFDRDTVEVWVYHNRKRAKTFDIYNHVWERDKDKAGSYL